jgi:hypothetical protein
MEGLMERMIDGVACVTAGEAAARLKTTPVRVLMLLKEKALEGMQVDGEWYVTEGSLACCITHGRDMKTEQGCRTYCSSGCGCKG